ncbi:MAG: hypothetical protein ACKVOK_04065 [Flavobacteriales bacterium]
MSQNFEILTRISFRHGYFHNSVATCFEVNPSQNSQTTLLNHGLLFKRYADGFVIAGEKNNHPVSSESEISVTLRLEVFVSDTTFYTITEALPKNLNNSIFYFRNAGELLIHEGENLLHSSSHVDENDLMFTYDSAKKPNFFGYIILAINPSLKKNYVIRFQEKQSYWKYILVSPHYSQTEHLMVVGEETNFRGPLDVELNDKKKAIIFISEKKLSMREQYSKHFQLIEKPTTQNNSTRILIQAMPTPSPTNISLSSKEYEEQNESYSEIII